MKFKLESAMEVHSTPNILLKSFRRKKTEKSNGYELKAASPVKTAWYLNEDFDRRNDAENERESTPEPGFQPTTEIHASQNILSKSFGRKKAEKNGNYLKAVPSTVSTSWYVDVDVVDGDDVGVERGEGRGGGGGGDGEEGGERSVQCVLLGDGMVGKTCLTHRYTQGTFTDHYTATVYDNYSGVPVLINGEKYVLNLSDTAGQSDYESLRTSTYESSEVLVLCFSVCDRESFHNILHCWMPEIQRNTKGRRPLVLVGTQTDLRTSTPSSPDPQDSDTSSSELKTFNSSIPDSKVTHSSTSDSKASHSSVSNSKASHSSTSDSKASKSSRSECKATNSSTSDSKATICSSSELKKNSHSSPSDFKTSKSSSSDRMASNSSSASSSSSSSSSPFPDEVSTEEGRQLAKVIGADCYLECSAQSEEGVQEVFEHVVSSALKYRKRKNRLLFCRLFSR